MEPICLYSIYTHRCACCGCCCCSSSILFNDVCYLHFMASNEGINIEQCNEGTFDEIFVAYFKALFSVYLVRPTETAEVPSV